MRKTLFLLIFLLLITSLLPAAGLAEGKSVMLVVSTGTKQTESRENAIGAIEKDLAAAYPDMEVRRAFMSELIISLIEEQDGVKFDTTSPQTAPKRQSMCSSMITAISPAKRSTSISIWAAKASKR